MYAAMLALAVLLPSPIHIVGQRLFKASHRPVERAWPAETYLFGALAGHRVALLTAGVC